MNTPIEQLCVIDDDSIYVFMLESMVKEKNLSKEVLHFENGEDAYKYLSNTLKSGGKMPDMILLDINMPIMDGWDFLEEMNVHKTSFPEKSVLYMVSSSVNQEDVIRAKSYQIVSDYIIKPIREEDLVGIFTR